MGSFGFVPFRVARSVIVDPTVTQATLAGRLVINGVSVTDGDLVLVATSADTQLNDLWTVSTTDVWVKSTQGTDQGALVLITEGTFQYQTFQCLTATVDQSAPTWVTRLTWAQLVSSAAIGAAIAALVAAGSSEVSSIASAQLLAALIDSVRILRRRVELLEEFLGIPDVNPVIAQATASPIGDVHAQYP